MSWTYQASPPISDQEYDRWERMLEERTGIFFSGHRSILRAGLWHRMREVGCGSFEEYYRRVCGFTPAASAEWTALVNGLTVRETRFFRHEPSFARVREHLLEHWDEDSSRPLQIWSAGCASGEETYSLAFVAAECAAYTGRLRSMQIVGSDISATALTEARNAVYPSARAGSMTPAQRARFLESAGSGYFRVRPEFARTVDFVQGNLLQPPAGRAGQCDVVFCQNVLIYFRPPKREVVLDALVSAMRPGGLLVTGAGETGQWLDPRLVRCADSSVQAWIRRPDNNN